MTDFSGKIALVTGAASGIGRATALEFAARGASVVVADYQDALGEATVSLIKAAGGKAVFAHADVSDEASVSAMVAKAVATFGGLDYLVNNAGIAAAGPNVPPHEVELAAFDKVQAVNLRGSFLGIKYAVPELLKRGGGAIVNVSSVAGGRGFAGDPSYVTSKHALVGLTKSVALTYASQGVRVIAVGPGVVKTAMTDPIVDDEPMRAWLMGETPMRRFAEPDEIAKVIVFLCSDGASYITGSYLPVDGGWLAG